MPTPTPTATDRMIFCNGKTRDTAVRAFSPMADTYMLSTMLYMDVVNMEIIGGIAMVSSNLITGFVPMGFAAGFFSSVLLISFLFKHKKDHIPAVFLRNNKIYSPVGHVHAITA